MDIPGDKHWQPFLILYETLQDFSSANISSSNHSKATGGKGQLHLVIPCLPLFDQILQGPLGIPWFTCIVQSAFISQSMPVRKAVLRKVLSMTNLKEMHLLRGATRFLFGPLLKLLSSSTYLYVSSEAEEEVEEADFASLVISFYTQFINSFKKDTGGIKDHESYVQAISFYLRQLAAQELIHVRGGDDKLESSPLGAVPLIHLLRPLLQIEVEGVPLYIIEERELDAMLTLSMSRCLHNPKARILVHKMLSSILMRFGISRDSAISDKLLKLLTILRPTVDDQTRIWFVQSNDELHILSSLGFLLDSIYSIEVNKAKVIADYVATLVSLVQGIPQLGGECFALLFRHLVGLDNNNNHHLLVTCFLLLAVNRALFQLNQSSIFGLLNVEHRLTSLLKLLEEAILLDKGVNDVDSLRSLVECYGACLQATGQQSTPDLDMYLEMTLVRYLNTLAQIMESASETWSLELKKASLMEMILVTLDRSLTISSFTSSTYSVIDPGLILDCELQSSAILNTHQGSTDQLWESWPELLVWFQVNKAHVLGRLVSLKIIDYTRVHLYTLDKLQVSKYNGSLSLLMLLAQLARDYPHTLASSILPALELFVKENVLSSGGPPTGGGKWVKAYACAVIDILIKLASGVSDNLEHIQTIAKLLSVLLDTANTRYAPIAVHMARRLTCVPRAFIRFTDICTRLLLYGPMRDIPEQTLAEQQLACVNVNEDAFVARAFMATIINEVTDCESIKVDQLMNLLMVKYVLFDRDPALIERAKKTAFLNTLAHRQRVRAWQALLCLYPLLTPTQLSSWSKEVWQFAIGQECMPSVRFFAEWWLTMALLKMGRDTAIAMMEEQLSPDLGDNLPAGPLISTLSVLYQFARTEPALVRWALDLSIPWFTHNSPTARAHVFWTVDRLMKIVNSGSGLSPPYPALAQMLSNANHCQRFIEKVSKAEPWLDHFDARQMFTLRGLFEVAPRLVGMAWDEQIPARVFELIAMEPK